MSLCVLLTALEASGDALGADLMMALRARLGGGVRFVGVGGPAMAAMGMASAFDIHDLSIVGLVDGLMAAGRASRHARTLAQMALREAPDVAVLIDSWGFSYIAAGELRRRLPALPLVKYVAPQVWATRPGRAVALAKRFDLLLSIIAFEPTIFERAGAKVEFVGHPALGPDRRTGEAGRFRSLIGAGADDPILLVLPGSRRSEIRRLAAPFEAALRLVKEGRPDLHVAVSAAPTVRMEVEAWAAGLPFRTHLVEGARDREEAMAAAQAALACSGTITTELAAAGCPMVVAYRLGALTWAIGKRIVRTPYATLLNIAAGEMIVPELIQDACTGPAIAEQLSALLDDAGLRARRTAVQAAALERLGRGVGPAVELAAEAVIRIASAALVDGDV